MHLSGAPPGHHPAWHVGFGGRKRRHRGLRIKPRQNRLSGTDPRRRRVLHDPIRAHRRAFIQNAPLRPGRRLRMGVFLCRADSGFEMTERRYFDWVAACRTHRFRPSPPESLPGPNAQDTSPVCQRGKAVTSTTCWPAPRVNLLGSSQPPTREQGSGYWPLYHHRQSL